ncbi:MAG: hypothetical protein ACOCWD_02660, partial [Tangfeifania sp.]
MNQPQPFCFNPNKIKAFVLGCDPTNFSDNGKPVELNYVFGIGQDQRYFSDILSNLQLLGLHLEDLYIQNLVTEYLDEETGKNKNWEAKANKYLTARKKEFDTIDPTSQIPVFLTAEKLYNVLLSDNEKKWKASELYTLKTEIPIPPEANKLIRPLIPLYRHYRYQLQKWPVY